MKRIFFAAIVLFCAMRAQASTDVNVSFSSAVYSGVTITTGTVIRCDNWVHGAQSGVYTIQSERNSVIIQNQDSADDIYVGYDANVSTAAASGLVGLKIIPDASGIFGLDVNSVLYCIAVDAAGASGVRIHLTQTGRK